jgi:integrase
MPRSKKPAHGRRRRKGSGSLIWVPKRERWVGRITLTDQDGIKKVHTVSAMTEEEAGDKLDELKRDARSGVIPDSRLRVSTYLTRWLKGEKSRVKPSTYMSREGHVRLYLVPHLGTHILKMLQPSHVEHMMNRMVRDGLSPRTANHARVTLRLALKDAERDGLVTRNAAALARPPRVERKEMTVLSADETRVLLDLTKGTRYGSLWALLATTGLRLGEALALTWDDIDIQAAQLRVTKNYSKVGRGEWAIADPKTKRSRRTVPLAPQLADALLELQARQAQERQAAGELWADDDAVFADEYGRRYEPTAVSAPFKRALKEAGLAETLRVHDLRHGFATQLLREGVPLVHISKLLGHSTLAITADLYTHLDGDDTNGAGEIMGRLLGRPA